MEQTGGLTYASGAKRALWCRSCGGSSTMRWPRSASFRAATPLRERREAGGEVPELRRLVHDAVAAERVLPRGHARDDLDDVVDVALGVGPPRDREPHEIERRRRLGAVGVATEHHRPDLAAAHAALPVELDGERLARVL